MSGNDPFEQRWRRERTARKRAEQLLEAKASELFRLNQALSEQLTERTRGLYLSRVAMDLAGDAVFMISDDGSFVYANDAGCRWLGYSVDELVKQQVFEVLGFTPEEWKAWWENLKASRSVQFEMPLRSRGGIERPTELTGSHLEFDAVEYSIIFARDISERTRVEAERRRREEENRRLSLIAARTSNAVVLTDREGRITWVNEGFERMTGYSSAEAMGHTPGFMLQGADTDPAVISAMREAVEAGTGFEIEILNYHKTGRPYWVAIEAQPLHDESGRVTQFMAIESDITQRKSQQEREARLALLRGISSDVLGGLIDDDAVNASVEHLLIRVGEFLGVSRARIVPTTASARLESLTWENPFFRPSQEDLDVPAFAAVAGIGAGLSSVAIENVDTWPGPTAARELLEGTGVKAIVAMPVVVSDQLEAVLAFEDCEQTRSWDPEEIAQIWSIVRALWLVLERQARKRLLERQAAQLADEATRAEKASRESSSFLANMSHEIRTPMTAIVGYADLLNRDSVDADLRADWTDALRSNANYLLSLVTDVLDLSKIEAGQLDLQKERLRLDSLLGDVLEIVRPRIREKLLQFRAYADSRLPRVVETDALRLRQILVNLLINASKFTEEGSIDVSLSSHVAGRRIVLEFKISDTGIGIDVGEVERMFEKFVQGSVGQDSHGGTGLGLPISRSLARMLGVEIVAASNGGSGAVFTVSIDAGPESEVEWLESGQFDPWEGARERSAESSKQRLDSRRLLVVDDNQENIRILRFLLEQAGANVEEAHDGREGVDTVLHARQAGRPFDAVLMDMSMPILDGYEATRELRSRGCDTPIIALTAYAMAGDDQRCLEAGCDRYMTKPIVAARLLPMVSELVTEHVSDTSSPAPVATGLDLSSDPALAPLVREYAAEFPATALEIARACRGLDAEAISRLAHRLRGTAANYGFPQIGEAAARCEDVIRGSRPWPEIAARAEALVHLLERDTNAYPKSAPIQS
ncbi:MAG: PAS domain-containing protein [Myxococcota bacterium]